MAQQKGQFFSGIIGPVVFYEFNGKQVARARARVRKKPKYSPAFKARSSNFGHASGLSSKIIGEISHQLKLPAFRFVQQRMAGAMARWLGVTPISVIAAQQPIPWLNDFRFNTETQLEPFWKKQIRLSGEVNEQLMLHIPAFRPDQPVLAPPGARTIQFSIAAVACEFEKKNSRQVSKTVIEIPYTSDEIPAQQIDLKIQSRAGEIVVVVASLVFKGDSYETMEGWKELKWRPVEVIGARYAKI